jgi:hypothetical protein
MKWFYQWRLCRECKEVKVNVFSLRCSFCDKYEGSVK